MREPKPPAPGIDGAAGAPALHPLLQELRAAIHRLSPPAAELAAAALVVQRSIPQAVSDWMIAEFSQRTDLSTVSPAAQAVMHITLAQTAPAGAVDASADIALVAALGKQKALQEAGLFLQRFAARLEALAHGL